MGHAFPRAYHCFALISEVHVPSDKHEVGINATLCQINSKGSFHVLSYASRQLKSHEANYSPFLLEMPNTFYGMHAFDEYLRRVPFNPYMDQQHQQPELSHYNKKTQA